MNGYKPAYITIALITFILLTIGSTGMGRQWESTTGATIEAEFGGFSRGMVALVTSEGKRMGIPFNRLSEKDQAFVLDKMDPPDIKIGGVKLDGWQRGLNQAGSVAVFEVMAMIQGESRMAANPKVELNYTFDTETRVRVEKQEKVQVNVGGRNRTVNETFHETEKREGSVSGSCSTYLFKKEEPYADLSKYPRVIRLKIPTDTTKESKTTYKLKSVKAVMVAKGKTVDEWSLDGDK